MVTECNSNKFYRIGAAAPSGIFSVEYGRIGCMSPAAAVYPAGRRESIYREKIRKGYRDITEQASPRMAAADAAAAHDEGEALVARLASMARGFIGRSCSVDLKCITQEMMDRAQQRLCDLKQSARDGADPQEFNRTLMQLFMDLPRAIRDTRAMTASSPDDYGRICDRESAFLDTLKGSVRILQESEGGADCAAIIAKAGLDIHPCTEEQESEIRRMMGASGKKLVHAWRVENRATRKAFDERNASRGISRVKKLWHGSRSENWLGILSSGLLLNPDARRCGDMFGHGIYFSPGYLKSEGYTSLNGSRWTEGGEGTGFMAIMDVATGKELDVRAYSAAEGRTDQRRLDGLGKDSLHAHAGSMLAGDEIVVYEEGAATIRYLAEVG